MTRTNETRWAIAGLALAILLSSLGVGSANVALPTLAGTFGASFPAVQWVVLSYLLAVTVMSVSVGRLGDVLGHRRVLLAGIALFAVASLVCGLAQSLWMLIGARALQGLGGATLLSLSLALVRQAVPQERTGAAMGLLGTVSAIGTATGPSLGGLLVAGPGWRWIFLALVPLSALCLLTARRHLPADDAPSKVDLTGFDGLGTLLLGLTLAAYTLGVTVGAAMVLLPVAGVLGVAFVYSQAKVSSPLLRLPLLRSSGLAASLAMNVLVFTVMMATLVLGPFYLSRALGLTATWVGLVMSLGPIFSALTGIPAGRLVDRLGAARMVTYGLTGLATGSAAMAVLPGRWGLAGYAVSIVGLTPGYQLFQAANNTQVMAKVPADQRGVVSGMLNLSRNLGLVTGASVMGSVFALAASTKDFGSAGPAALGNALRVAFTVAAGLAVAAVLVSLTSRPFATPAHTGQPEGVPSK